MFANIYLCTKISTQHFTTLNLVKFHTTPCYSEVNKYPISTRHFTTLNLVKFHTIPCYSEVNKYP
ncbi:hypothetical protein QE417_004200 [Mucilaginibacter terrae]|uniref:Uncharacterized protein n=1 Tax=Mucilaginibacter terrae TaxID=1955052 RepID=A0ABU3GZD5_9SPHI|nr:hypothetical protein [Mucilaginibacter terrae]